MYCLQQSVCGCVVPVLAALLAGLPAGDRCAGAGSVAGVDESQQWLDAGPVESIRLSTTKAARSVPAHFLSDTHDAYFMVADLGIQPVWNDSRLLNMVGALAPSKFRVGGGDMDYTENKSFCIIVYASNVFLRQR